MTLKKDLKEVNFDPSKYDKTDMVILQILGDFGARKDELGVIDLSVQFGRECWNLGREEMEKEKTKVSEVDPD